MVFDFVRIHQKRKTDTSAYDSEVESLPLLLLNETAKLRCSMRRTLCNNTLNQLAKQVSCVFPETGVDFLPKTIQNKKTSKRMQSIKKKKNKWTYTPSQNGKQKNSHSTSPHSPSNEADLFVTFLELFDQRRVCGERARSEARSCRTQLFRS